MARASALCSQASSLEKGLIEALAARFPPDDKIPDFDQLNRMYANEMRNDVYRDHTGSADAAALFAEALMCISLRGLWHLDTGKLTSEHTLETRNVIEAGFKLPTGDKHPALCHLYIHLLGVSPFPD